MMNLFRIHRQLIIPPSSLIIHHYEDTYAVTKEITGCHHCLSGHGKYAGAIAASGPG
jgi:hypothetical protein